MLTSDEKEYLRIVVERELTRIKESENTISMDAALKFLKAEHEYVHFLEKLAGKLK